MARNKLKTVSLFTGAGGIDLGAERAGAKVIFSNEIDPVICQTLKQNFPNTKVAEGDIKKIDYFPKADLVIGGYPCQSFSLGGNRNPEKDHRTYLYLEYARALKRINPRYFVAENVSGLSGVKGGIFLKNQLDIFSKIGKGYNISHKVLNAKDYGVPQRRRRIFLVGVRNDLNSYFEFPNPTHGTKGNLLPYTSHGDAISDLPIHPEGEFYEREKEDSNFSWYYMSRNRKAKWKDPSFTIVANWRHVTLHPASPVMKLTWSNLKDGFKQRWDFSNKFEHTAGFPNRKKLRSPRRLSWRECARIQTFPDSFKFCGDTEKKYLQVGNAVPPLLAEVLIKHLISGAGLKSISKMETKPRQASLVLH